MNGEMGKRVGGVGVGWSVCYVDLGCKAGVVGALVCGGLTQPVYFA